MRRIVVSLILLFSLSLMSHGQIKDARKYFYNLNPQKLDTVLDSISSTDISFAFSLRRLKADYTGFCIKIRRSSDNSEQDIGFNGDGLVDTIGINNFAGASTIYVTKWYDQSGLGRNAIQATSTQQPIFLKQVRKGFPVIKFDGVNDILVVETSIQLLTNAGDDGSIFYVGDATARNQWSFGTTKTGTPRDRWSVHINWSNNRTYFDPGYCCNSTRSFDNVTRQDSFDQYTFIRSSTTVSMRQDGMLKITGSHTTGGCSHSNYFGVGAARTDASYYQPSNNSFHELIMFKTNVPSTLYDLLEANQVRYWKI